MAFFYLVSGVVLSSHVELSTVTPLCASATADVSLAIEPGDAPEPAGWFLERMVPGVDKPFMATARVDGGYLVRCGERATFRVRRDGSEIVAYLATLSLDAIEQLLLDQVLPQALQLRGECSLHASSVGLGEVAVAFLGRSGEGKSTLASAMVPPGALLGDDCLAMRRRGEVVMALPSYASVRLREDSVENVAPGVALRPASSRMTWKQRLPLPAASGEVRLARIFVLARGEAISIEPLGPAEALAELAKQVHRLDPEDRTALRREFEVLTDVIKHVVVCRLTYPRDYAALPQVVAAVRASVGLAQP